MSLIYQRRVECLLESLFVWTYLTSTHLPQVVQSGHLWATLVLSSWNSLKDNAALTCCRTTRTHMDLTPLYVHIFLRAIFFVDTTWPQKTWKLPPPPPQKTKTKTKNTLYGAQIQTHVHTCSHSNMHVHAQTRTYIHVCTPPVYIYTVYWWNYMYHSLMKGCHASCAVGDFA